MSDLDWRVLEVWDRVQSLRKYSVSESLREVAQTCNVSIEYVAKLVGVEL